MKRKYLPIALAAAFVMNHNIAVAKSSLSDDIRYIWDELEITLEGQASGEILNGQGPYKGGITPEGSYATLGLEFNKRVKAYITVELMELFDKENLKFDSFQLDKFISEAAVEITLVEGKPYAVIIGKHAMAFGQGVEASPSLSKNILREHQSVDGVFGITLELKDGLKNIFDSVEISIHESSDEAGDLKVGSLDAGSIRVSRMLTESTTANASISIESGGKKKASIGLIQVVAGGQIVLWGEALYLKDHPEFNNKSTFGLAAGALYSLNNKTDVMIEYSWLENTVYELMIGTSYAINEKWSVGAEARYRKNEQSGDDDFILGLTVTYKFGAKIKKRKEQTYVDNADDIDDEFRFLEEEESLDDL